MKRLPLALVLLASMVLIGSAWAGPASQAELQRLAKLTRVSILVPPEWDGIWTTQDSLYDCQGFIQFTFTGKDTLCGGRDYVPGGGIQYDCTGTANATTLDLTCTGTAAASATCDGHYSAVVHGTRTGTTFFIYATTNITYTGSDCTGYDATCIQVNSHGTYSSASPPTFCATPVRQSTWGEIKIIYR